MRHYMWLFKRNENDFRGQEEKKKIIFVSVKRKENASFSWSHRNFISSRELSNLEENDEEAKNSITLSIFTEFLFNWAS